MIIRISFVIVVYIALIACASAQTTNGEWVAGHPHWGLAVYNARAGGYWATGPVHFYADRQACARDGEAAVRRIVFGNPSCTAMYCRPYAFWTCSKLDEGASGRIAQVPDFGQDQQAHDLAGQEGQKVAPGNQARSQSAAGLCLRGQVCCTMVFVAPPPGPPYLPGHSQRVCGTLEQFERRATIACLRSKAVENPSTALAIRLAGDCLAAKLTAAKVRDVQQMNARNHEEALKAQRELRAMGVPASPR